MQYSYLKWSDLQNTVSRSKENGGVKKVIFNDPATIVYWSDGDKTVVKCMKGETFNRWTGFAMAVCKKMMCENDPVKFHRWMKRNCGEDEPSPSINIGEDFNSEFKNFLNNVLGIASMANADD